MLADCTAHSAALPRLELQDDLPLLLLSAAALPDLVEVRSNFRLPRSLHQCGERSNAAFAQAVCRRSSRHSRLTIVRRGCETQRLAEDSWRSHVHRTRLRSACSSSRSRLPMSGVEGDSPRVLLGDLKGAILSRERMARLCPHPAGTQGIGSGACAAMTVKSVLTKYDILHIMS